MTSPIPLRPKAETPTGAERRALIAQLDRMDFDVAERLAGDFHNALLAIEATNLGHGVKDEARRLAVHVAARMNSMSDLMGKAS